MRGPITAACFSNCRLSASEFDGSQVHPASKLALEPLIGTLRQELRRRNLYVCFALQRKRLWRPGCFQIFRCIYRSAVRAFGCIARRTEMDIYVLQPSWFHPRNGASATRRRIPSNRAQKIPPYTYIHAEAPSARLFKKPLSTTCLVHTISSQSSHTTEN